MTDATPDWLDRGAYPFEPYTFETADGRMHYVDEGEGPPVVLVHGTPTWSFLWRGLIRALAPDHRVIAPDHLGFGLSDKPPGAPYRPEDHARRLASLIDGLGLHDVALVVHDFGGPIGLSYAVERPENVQALVVYNTWMWSKAGDPATVRASRLLGGPLGRWLYTRLNLSPRVLLPAVYADKATLTAEIHRHYMRPFPDAASRHAPATLARELVASSTWYDSLWARRGVLAEMPALIVWGERDPTFGSDDLRRWREALPQAWVRTYPDAGHVVQEEAPESAVTVADFLRG